MKFVPFALVLTIAVAHADPTDPPALTAAIAAVNAYAACTAGYAKTYAKADVTASEIAEAALAFCLAERSKLRDALRLGLDRQAADQSLEESDTKARRIALEVVIGERMPLAKPAAPKK